MIGASLAQKSGSLAAFPFSASSLALGTVPLNVTFPLRVPHPSALVGAAAVAGVLGVAGASAGLALPAPGSAGVVVLVVGRFALGAGTTMASPDSGPLPPQP